MNKNDRKNIRDKNNISYENNINGLDNDMNPTNAKNIEILHDMEFEASLSEMLDQEFSPCQTSKDRVRDKLLESIHENNLSDGVSLDGVKDKHAETIDSLHVDIVEDRKEEKPMKNSNNTIRNIRDKNSGKKKSRHWSKSLVAASIAALLVIGVGLPVAGSDYFVTTKTLKSEDGNIEIIEEKPLIDLGKLIYHFPKNLKGQIYDARGNQIDEVSYKEAKNTGVFDKNGDKIHTIDEKNGTFVLEKDADKTIDEGTAKFNTLEEAQKYLTFTPKLPAGCKLIEVELFKDENGLVDESDSIGFTLEKDGAKIYMQERVAKKENGYSTNADHAEYVYLNGVRAIMTDNKDIHWEADGLIISIGSRTSKFFGQSLVDLAATIK